MNIVLLSQNFHPMVGGIETQARLFAQTLSDRHRVTVAAVNFRPSRVPARFGVLVDNVLIPPFESYSDGAVRVEALTPGTLERLRLLPIGVRAVPRLQRYAYQPLFEFGYFWYRRVFVRRLLRVLKDAEIVHALCGGYLGWSAQEAAKSLGIPFVCTPYVHPNQWGDDRANIAYYRKCDAVLALVETDRDFLISLGVESSRIQLQGVVPLLPPTADPAGFRARHGLGEALVILYVGRMMAAKGAPALLSAAQYIWSDFPAARLVFIGPHDSAAGSEQWFLNLDPRILFLGKVSEQEKADALAACDVFCMPSTSEILPAAYLEAWTYCKPVVGGNAPGLAELIEGNGAGIVVPQEASSIGRALTRLLADPRRRLALGQRGANLVRRRYSKESVVGSLEGLYEQLTAQSGQTFRKSGSKIERVAEGRVHV